MIEGMETIVATVSGYHGSQRLKLIQLITAVGANYVGKLSKCTTHLICWKFKGEKYELANKFGTIVVNHRWLEDCVKEGKRVSEHPYSLMSGQDVGSLMSERSAVMELARPLKENKLFLNQISMQNNVKEVIDLDSDEIEDDDFYKELLDENLIPEPERKTIGRRKTKRKVIKDASRSYWRATSDNQTSNHVVESEESDHLLNLSNKQRRRNADWTTATDFGESSRRSRRLVKKAKSGTVKQLQSRILANKNLGPSSSSFSDDSSELREEIDARIYDRNVIISSPRGRNKHKTNHMIDISLEGDAGLESDDILDDTGMNLPEISSTYQNMEVQPENKDLAHNLAKPQKPLELSCVICWTEFSSSRGVLPCGHRFCFSCIQQWADHMASSRKETTCPLCKATFASITRVDAAASLDQKIYSQTVPAASSLHDIFIVPEAGSIHSNTRITPPAVCCQCQSPNPVDLLLKCQMCEASYIHSYCLDPPLIPWTCFGCRDRRLFYR